MEGLWFSLIFVSKTNQYLNDIISKIKKQEKCSLDWQPSKHILPVRLCIICLGFNKVSCQSTVCYFELGVLLHHIMEANQILLQNDYNDFLLNCHKICCWTKNYIWSYIKVEMILPLASSSSSILPLFPFLSLR